MALARALVLVPGVIAALATPLFAQEKAQLFATNEDGGFGRLVLSFPDRLDLPEYELKYDNGVVAIEFDEAIAIPMPDVAVTLKDYVGVARLDPDRKGIRFGLRTPFRVNRLEAGERLFIDLLPLGWQGLPPGLPPEVVEELAERSRKAAIIAEQRRKAEEAKTVKPVATLQLGRNPTFLRIQFDWSADTKGAYELAPDDDKGIITFDWPVGVDLYDLKADLPPEILSADNFVSADGSRVEIKVGDGVEPRFYQTGPRQFLLDIDIDKDAGVAAAIAIADEREQALQAALDAAAAGTPEVVPEEPSTMAANEPAATSITPMISTVGGTIRVAFPFDQDTPAAVFRRGDVVWMLFDTAVSIEAPANTDALSAIASGFEIIPAGATKVVRLDLSSERLATLGSEGRSWVLSLGDVLLNPTEPMPMRRSRDDEGHLQMSVDLRRPAQLHEFRDPVAGDTLKVVTAFPPARGVVRDLQYVDFEVLRSVHGLVVRSENEGLEVAIEGSNAVLGTPDGLTLSPLENVRLLDSGNAPEYRSSYVDFTSIGEDDPLKLVEHRESLIERASQSEGRLRDVARLELAQFQLANQFAMEAIGVLKVLEEELDAEDLRRKVRLTRGIADTLARRPIDALAILNSDTYATEVDALMWRSVAKGDLGDFAGARVDAIAAEGILDAYPNWVQLRFLLSAARAAVETKDSGLALHFLERVEFAKLDIEQVTQYQLLQGRVAELENRIDEALDTYGQVIAADIRPTRAEAVYRTLLLLDDQGRIDIDKATATLGAEVLLWRGNTLEADMQKLLAELYFRRKDYRLGFETVKEAVARHPENPSINALLVDAQKVFGELYLDGRADELAPVDALSLYYDFRQLTPAGVRGDEMIRNLARRLVKVDLLTQAADLLEYQIDSRLKGVAQAQIAADLAVIRIADRDPEGALRALNRTRLADLSPALERQRRILEARALIDAGREVLAVDLLSTLDGRDADQLRVEALWRTKSYGPASELLEIMYSPGLYGDPLQQPERMSIIRAAVGFVLANDKLALSRLRSKFSEEMAKSAEWGIFEYVTGDVAPTSVQFREVARQVSGLDSLNAFLAAYRLLYAAGDAVAPDQAAPEEAA